MSKLIWWILPIRIKTWLNRSTKPTKRRSLAGRRHPPCLYVTQATSRVTNTSTMITLLQFLGERCILSPNFECRYKRKESQMIIFILHYATNIHVLIKPKKNTHTPLILTIINIFSSYSSMIFLFFPFPFLSLLTTPSSQQQQQPVDTSSSSCSLI